MIRLDYYRAIDKALRRLKPYATPKLGELAKESRAIAVYPLPTPVPYRYADGSRILRMGFDVQCKSPEQGEALSFAESVADLLDDHPEHINANRLEIYQEPFLAYKTDSGEYVYIVSFHLEAIKERS